MEILINCNLISILVSILLGLYVDHIKRNSYFYRGQYTSYQIIKSKLIQYGIAIDLNKYEFKLYNDTKDLHFHSSQVSFFLSDKNSTDYRFYLQSIILGPIQVLLMILSVLGTIEFSKQFKIQDYNELIQRTSTLIDREGINHIDIAREVYFFFYPDRERKSDVVVEIASLFPTK